MQEAIETVAFITAVLFLVVVLPLGLLRKQRMINRRKEAAEIARSKAEELKRLRNPDFAAFTKRYKCEPSASLKDLYENPESNLDGNFRVKIPSFRNSFFVSYFNEVTAESIDVDLSWLGVGDLFSFASDDCGNSYSVNPHQANPMVYFLDHELEKPVQLNIPLSEFLTTKRIAVK